MESNRRRLVAGLAALDRGIEKLLSGLAWLVLPLSLLLFLQWPLRDIVQSYSREANDLAQILFALYVSSAITATTRRHGHLCTGGLTRLQPGTRLQLERFVSLVILVPWSSYVLWAAWPGVWQAIRGVEAFPDTYNPGFFIVKMAVGLMVGLILLQGLVHVFRCLPDESS